VLKCGGWNLGGTQNGGRNDDARQTAEDTPRSLELLCPPEL
jgi:hypothetical protein